MVVRLNTVQGKCCERGIKCLLPIWRFRFVTDITYQMHSTSITSGVNALDEHMA